MKKCIYISLLFFIFHWGNAQKLSLRIEWNAMQVNRWETKSRINVDTTFYEDYHHYIDEIRQLNKFSIDVPGLSLEFRTPKNFFFISGLKFTSNKFITAGEQVDSVRVNPTYKFRRLVSSWEAGYYFRGCKLFKPYFSTGITLTKIFSKFDNKYYSEYSAYTEYFSSTPVFLSALFKTGVKYGPFSIGINYSISLTKTSSDDKLGAFRTIGVLNLTYDLFRSSIIKKTQYKSNFEKDELKITRSQVLKQSEFSWNLGVPYYRFISKHYIDAYQNSGTINSVIEVSEPPVAAFVPFIAINNVYATNAKRTHYFQTNLGFSHIRLNYKGAKNVSSASYSPITSTNDPITSTHSDIKLIYNALWFGIGNGFKIKTTRRSFIFMDYDLRINHLGRDGKDKDAVWEIPPIKKMFLSVSIEGGLKFNHMGMALSLERNLGKLDEHDFYLRMYNLSLKFIYDVSSR